MSPRETTPPAIATERRGPPAPGGGSEPPTIPISRDHSVGTAAHPYHFADPVGRRTAALHAGIAAREALLDERAAKENLRKRLNALRVVRRRSPECLIAENDYAWLTQLIEGARAAPACLYYTHAASEGTPLRARLGRLLWGWFAGPWSMRIPPRDASGETTVVPADVVIVPRLLDQTRGSPPADPDLVQKAASSDEFSHFLNYLTLDEPRLARKVAAARSPKRAVETLAAHWPRVVAHEQGAWRLRTHHLCPASAQGCV